MSEPKKTSSVEFVKLEESTPTKSRASLLIAFILVLSFMANVYFVMLPDIGCPNTSEPVLNQLDECSVNLEHTQERVIQCLYQRSLEMTSREDAFNECVAELKTIEEELDLYKKDGTDEEEEHLE
jgi:hypothetical protein